MASKRLLCDRVTELGSDFEQGLENESPLQHVGMRNDELRHLYDVVAIEKEVDVDKARPLGTACASAATFAFDPLQDREKLQWERTGLGGCRDIEKPGLVLDILRFGFVKGRPDDDVDVFGFEASQSLLNILPTVAEIRSQREVDRLQRDSSLLPSRLPTSQPISSTPKCQTTIWETLSKGQCKANTATPASADRKPVTRAADTGNPQKPFRKRRERRSAAAMPETRPSEKQGTPAATKREVS
jgi:hypothetical protein